MTGGAGRASRAPTVAANRQSTARPTVNSVAALTSRTRTNAAWRPTRRSRCARSGPALLEMNENVSTRPLWSVTTPASALVPVSDPVLARSQPAAAATGDRIEEAVGQRAAAAGDRQQVQQRAAAPAGPVRPPRRPRRRRVVAVSRSIDRQPAGVHQRRAGQVDVGGASRLVTASTAPAKLSGRCVCGGHLARDALGHHVVGVDHHLAQPLDQRRGLHRRQFACRSPARGPWSPRPDRRRARPASARPASSAGVRDRFGLDVDRLDAARRRASPTRSGRYRRPRCRPGPSRAPSPVR